MFDAGVRVFDLNAQGSDVFGTVVRTVSESVVPGYRSILQGDVEVLWDGSDRSVVVDMCTVARKDSVPAWVFGPVTS
jgi:hypothetical protein